MALDLARFAPLFMVLATPSVGCSSVVAVDADSASLEGAAERESAIQGQKVDPRDLLGTYDFVGSVEPSAEAQEFKRFILLRDGTIIACPDASSAEQRVRCNPFDRPVGAFPHHPYEVLETGGGRFLVVRTSTSDPTPFRVYAIAAGSDPLILNFRALGAEGSGPRFSMRRLPCSETMYQDESPESACAYYQCKLDHAPLTGDRCSYFSEFALPYCQKYSRAQLHQRDFVSRARRCLQEAVRDTMEHKACDVVKEEAFRSHVDCYVAAGFCKLSFGDKLKIAREIELRDFNIMNAKTVVSTQKKCHELHLDD